MRVLGTIAALILVAGCVLPPEDYGGSNPLPPLPADVGIGPPDGTGYVPPVDTGGPQGPPVVKNGCPPRASSAAMPFGGLGSGTGGDDGAALLWLVRIDRGTANTADAIQRVMEQTVAAMKAAGLAPRGLAVASLADGAILWANSNVGSAPDGGSALDGVASMLAARAITDLPAPSSCADGVLAQAARNAASIRTSGGAPLFALAPAALFVGIVDSGPRPVPFTGCAGAATLGSDPVPWTGLGLRIGQVRYGFFATPEAGDTTSMRNRCLSVAGLPSSVVDALAPSTVAYFDPLTASINARCSGVAARVDLCDAFGSGLGNLLTASMTDWVRLLVAMQ